MKGPQTYTGEDVVEFQYHGGNFTNKHTLMCALKRELDPQKLVSLLSAHL